MRDPTAGYEATKRIATAARLPKFISSGASQVHIGLLIGFVVVLVAWFLLYKSKFGYESRTVGTNKAFALFSGINIRNVIISGSVVAGIMTGLGSACEISGFYDRLRWVASPGYGWDAIMIATLARNNPALVIPRPCSWPTSVPLRTSLNISSVVPPEVVEIAQQVVIVLIAAKGLLSSVEKRTIVKNANKQIAYEKEEA